MRIAAVICLCGVYSLVLGEWRLTAAPVGTQRRRYAERVLAGVFGTVIWALGAVVIFYVVWKVGIGMTRSLTTQLPDPPPEGELRKVSVRYRCSNCGTELRMTLAPEADPPPPRHCMEEMDQVTPVE